MYDIDLLVIDGEERVDLGEVVGVVGVMEDYVCRRVDDN